MKNQFIAVTGRLTNGEASGKNIYILNVNSILFVTEYVFGNKLNGDRVTLIQLNCEMENNERVLLVREPVEYFLNILGVDFKEKEKEIEQDLPL